MPLEEPEPRLVSVVIPARNEAAGIDRTVRRVLAQHVPGFAVEVIVVDDGSSDDTARIALRAGARVVALVGSPGNPGVARNRGAAEVMGDPIVFLDADCLPHDGWLSRLVAAHDARAALVGGAIEHVPGGGLAARCNHYCAAYHLHPRRARGPVRNHTPANLSVRRAAFLSTAGFAERLPVADGHEELAWQDALRRGGHEIVFEPAAVVGHVTRAGWPDLFRRNYRWAYSAIRAKSTSQSVRARWLYRSPLALILLAPAFAVAHTAYTVVAWARAGVLAPIALLPAIFAARAAYAAGLVAGGVRDLVRPGAEHRAFGGRWR